MSYTGFTPSPAAPTVYSYLKNATSIGSTTTGSATSQTVPAYSIVVLQLHPGTGGTGSPTPTPSPTSGGTGGCTVGYSKNEWQGGMTANVTITNNGSTAVNGWTLAFSFPGDTKVGNVWNATMTQNGTAVRATNASYNATIAPGGNVSFGFSGAWTAGDASPTGFTLNGAICAAG